MGCIGGALGYRLLKRISPGGLTAEKYCSGSAYDGKSKLGVFFDRDMLDQLVGAVVLDYGCGSGDTCIELARLGARRVLGLDIQEHLLDQARAKAQSAGVAHICHFGTTAPEAADAVISLDAFEHFEDPAAVLRQIHGLLRPGGSLLAEFGPTWFHPLGGHLFSVFPWAHLIFTEPALMRWRADFKTDGATRFREVAGGLNQMTIKRWEQIVAESDFRLASFEPRPIRGLAPLHCRLTREWLTAVVVTRLTRA